MTYEQTKAVVWSIISTLSALGKMTPKVKEVAANLELSLVSIHKVAQDARWEDICSDIAATGIDLES